MESLAVLITPQFGAMERWFEVALDRKDYEAALHIGDRIRRHRFFTALSFGIFTAFENRRPNLSPHQPASSSGGENYGWRCYEADQALFPDECTGLSLTFPVSTYAHDFGCSVTGGFVYRGAAVTELYGKYIYADFCSGSFWSLEKQGQDWITSPLPDTEYRPTSFGEDEAGELYFTNYSAGEIYMLVPSFRE